MGQRLHSPTRWAMASWVRVPALSLALTPGWRTSAPATKIASAVAVQTNRVSTTTPKA